MREIKFRALVRFGQHNKYHWIYYTPKTRQSEFRVVTGIKVEDSQYTGLKDKNGVEIYEGDIVKAEDGIWQITITDLEDGVVLDNDETKKISTDFYKNQYCLRETEVIGNIYENNDLLTIDK